MKNMNTTKSLTLSNQKTSHVQKRATAMILGNLGIKQVMIADLGDGAYTDQSIKVKPNRTGPGFVLKCVDRNRLLAGLAQAGIDSRLVKIEHGSKHWIAWITVGSTGQALVKL